LINGLAGTYAATSFMFEQLTVMLCLIDRASWFVQNRGILEVCVQIAIRREEDTGTTYAGEGEYVNVIR